MLALGEETAAQAVVGSIVWALHRLKKPRSREMSARGYALHSVCPQLSYLPLKWFVQKIAPLPSPPLHYRGRPHTSPWTERNMEICTHVTTDPYCPHNHSKRRLSLALRSLIWQLYNHPPLSEPQRKASTHKYAIFLNVRPDFTMLKQTEQEKIGNKISNMSIF